MNDMESAIVTVKELVDFAHLRGLDINSICHTGGFYTPDRYIIFWRKEKCIRYSLQGRILVLPEKYKDSSNSFIGMWEEAGELDTIGQAFEFLNAWMFDGKEVDALPARRIRSDGIC